MKTLFQEDEEHYYEPKRVTNFSSYDYIEYEINDDKNRNLSLDEYFNETEPYLRNTIIDLKNSDTWKIQLAIVVNIISSKDAEEERVMHSRSNNINSTSYNDASEVVDEHFMSLHSRYWEDFETSITGSDVIFDSVQLMYYKCNAVSFRCGGSYIGSPGWIKKKKQQ